MGLLMFFGIALLLVHQNCLHGPYKAKENNEIKRALSKSLKHLNLILELAGTREYDSRDGKMFPKREIRENKMKKRLLAIVLSALLLMTSATQAHSNSAPTRLEPQLFLGKPGLKQSASLGFTQLKTSFGFVRVTNIKRPAKYKCSTASVAVDIRNMSKLNMFGLKIDLLDDFDNVVGHAVVDTWDEKTEEMKKNGVYKTKMIVCAKAHKWTGLYFFDDPIKPITASNKYTLEVTNWLNGAWWGSVKYTLKK